MLLDPAHARLEVADGAEARDLMTEVSYLQDRAPQLPAPARQAPCASDRISAATSARKVCMSDFSSERSASMSDLITPTSDRIGVEVSLQSPAPARIWRRSSRIRLAGSSVTGHSNTVSEPCQRSGWDTD